MPAKPIKRLQAALSCVLAVLLAACGSAPDAPEGAMQMPPAEVSVAEVVEKQVQEWDTFSGRVQAVESVELRPRVAGYLAALHFKEGSEVAKGDLLFEIDDREYRAAVARAEADRNGAATRLELARQELTRGERLLGLRAASAEEIEQQRARVQQGAAELQSADAALSQARLNLDFTRITAPIDGRIGAAEVTVGNLVDPASVLSLIVSMDPVHVVFEGDERTYLRYQSQARRGERPSARDEVSVVRLGLADEEGFPYVGELDFIDNQVDPSTGTIRARARFDNADRRFTPGLYARVQHHQIGDGQRRHDSDDGHRGHSLNEAEPVLILDN